MKDASKTKKELIRELTELRHRVAELEASDVAVSSADPGDSQVDERLRLLSSTVEQSSEGIAVADLEGNLLFVNNAFAVMHGYTPQELLGRHLSIFHTAEQMPAVAAANQQIQETGEFSGEIWHVRRDGTVFPTLMHNSLFRDEAGNPTGMIGTLRDTTERKKLEEQMNLLSAAVRTSVDGISVVSPVDGKLLFCNEAFLKQWRLKGDYHNLSYPECFDSDEDTLHEAIRATMAGGWIGELEARRMDGRTFPVLVTSSPVTDEHGKTIGLLGIFRDITRQKAAEAALRESEEKFRNIFESAHDGIIHLSRSGEILDVNERAVQLFGGAKKGLLGKHFTQVGVFPLRDVPRLTSAFSRVLAGKQATLDLQIKNLQGGQVHLECSASLTMAGGKAVGMMVIARDITERKRAQEELVFKNALLGAQSETSIDGIWAVDTEGRSILHNKRFAEMWNVPPRILDAADDETILEHISDQLRDPDAFLGKVRYLYRYKDERSRDEIECKDGRVFDGYSSPLIDADGTHHGRIWYFRDVTENKKMEEALKESEEKYRNLVENMPEVIYSLDTEGRITSVNRALKTVLGLDPEEVVGRSFAELASEAVLSQAMTDHKQILTGNQITTETIMIDRDGNPHDIEYSSVAAIRDGRVLGSQGIARDITRRKKAEEKLKKYAERLQEMVEERTRELQKAQEQSIRREKLAVLGQLSGGVGHELRNPLGAIKNAAYFLNMVLEEPEPDMKEALEILEKEVQTCERIISSLLSFARPKPPTLRKVDVNELLKDVLSRISVPDEVEVVSRWTEGLPNILADPDQLAQAFGNIIVNGIQAMPEGGRLTVRTGLEGEMGSPEPDACSSVEGGNTETKSPSGCVFVSVADTGVGIPEENLERLFEPLFTTKPSGIGLGLAITKLLTEANGGAIEVSSPSTDPGPNEAEGLRTDHLGKGSAFTVRLPVAPLGTIRGERGRGDTQPRLLDTGSAVDS